MKTPDDIVAIVSGTGRIVGVRKAEIDGRPQLLIDIIEQNGATLSLPLDRDTARSLTQAFGHHPLVDEFFRSGQGLQ